MSEKMPIEPVMCEPLGPEMLNVLCKCGHVRAIHHSSGRCPSCTVEAALYRLVQASEGDE